MALHDSPKSLGTLLAGAAAAVLLLIVVGLHVQAAAFSEDQDALARRALALVPGMAYQLEATVTIPRNGHVVQGADPTCLRSPAPGADYNSQAVCRDVVVTGIPARSRNVSMTAMAKEPETEDWQVCSPSEDGRPFFRCDVEGLRFLSGTLVTERSGALTLTWTAMSTRSDRSGDVRVVVQFEGPDEPAAK